MMTTAMTDARFVALKLYRINLHGTGWKIESCAFGEAREMLAEHIRLATAEGDFAALHVLKDVRADLHRLQLSKPVRRAA